MRKVPRHARNGVWVCALGLLAWGTPGAAQRPWPVTPGDRVRVWPAAVVPPHMDPATPLVGRLLTLGPDTLQLRDRYNVQIVPRSAIARIERSIGHPHAWRNAGLAFFGTMAVGTALAMRVPCPASGDFGAGRGGLCAVGAEIFLVMPVSGLAALMAGTRTPERFDPATFPTPPS